MSGRFIRGNCIKHFKGKNFYQYSFLLAGLLLLGVAFNNCSKVGVSEIAKPSIPDSNGLTFGTPKDPNPLIATCADAKAKGTLRVAHLTGSFPDPGKQCDWSLNGNLSILDGSIRARLEQRQVFQVSNLATTKTTICNIQMTSTLVSKFYYDDNVFMTLNGYILASTSDFSRHLESSRGFFRYDWSRLVTKPAQNAASDSTAAKQYCAGQSTGVSSCQFPQTETVGTAQLQIGESVIQNILGMTDGSQFELSVITTGDNDKTDCQHVPIDLNMDVQYITE